MFDNRDKTIAITQDSTHTSKSIAEKSYDELMPMYNRTGKFDPEALAILAKSFVDMQNPAQRAGYEQPVYREVSARDQIMTSARMTDARHSDLLFHTTGQTDGPVSVYFERLDPAHPTGRPVVVMVHGGAHSGACYLYTANGEPGWAYEFVRRGYPVVVPDWPGIGRSGSIPLDKLTGEVVVERSERPDPNAGPADRPDGSFHVGLLRLAARRRTARPPSA